MSSVGTTVDEAPTAARWWRRLGSVEALAVVIVAVVLGRGLVVGAVDSAAALTLTAVFASLTLQALPFLVIGTLLRGGLRAFVPGRLVDRAMRHDLVAAVLASPAISPVVLAATAVAFPGHPSLVLARVAAGIVVAALAALLSRRLGQPVPRAGIVAHGWQPFVDSCRRDIVRGGGVLVVGAAVMAVLAVALPVRSLDTLAAYPLVAVVAAALLAVLLCQRAEADAVLVAALGQFSLTSRLVFLVVGPAINLRRFSRQTAEYGTAFALRYAPGVLLLATVVAAGFGRVLL